MFHPGRSNWSELVKFRHRPLSDPPMSRRREGRLHSWWKASALQVERRHCPFPLPRTTQPFAGPPRQLFSLPFAFGVVRGERTCLDFCRLSTAVMHAAFNDISRRKTTSICHRVTRQSLGTALAACCRAWAIDFNVLTNKLQYSTSP